MKRKLILTFLLLPSICALCQNQGNIWYFGFGAGLDFNSTIPTVIVDGQTGFGYGHIEGTSIISDNSGNLLFYTDGSTVWNKDHQIMLNGTGLTGHYSSTQSAIIVPAPVDPDRYFYIFTVGVGSPSYTFDARYSIVDICLDNGNGDIINTEKNIILGDSLPEKLAVTRHSNGTDYWILTHKHFTNEFWAFLLTSSGISDTVITDIGPVLDTDWATSFGQLKFSPNGQRVAICTSNISTICEILDFDKSTGTLSNSMDLELPNNDLISTYGVEFSPDNSKLYINGRSSTGVLFSVLAQYDLSSNDLPIINSSMYLLYQDTTGILGGQGMQLGPDGKIYMPSQDHQQYLSVINNPNNVGVSCNYEDSSLYMNGKMISFTMPSFISGYDYSNTESKCDVSITENVFSEKRLIKVVDLLGRETEISSNKLLVYIYSDGSIEKVIRFD